MVQNNRAVPIKHIRLADASFPKATQGSGSRTYIRTHLRIPPSGLRVWLRVLPPAPPHLGPQNPPPTPLRVPLPQAAGGAPQTTGTSTWGKPQGWTGGTSPCAPAITPTGPNHPPPTRTPSSTHIAATTRQDLSHHSRSARRIVEPILKIPQPLNSTSQTR